MEIRGRAIIANLHDVVIILGFFALFQWEFSLPARACSRCSVFGERVGGDRDRIRKLPQDEEGGVTEIIDNASPGRSRHHHHHGCTRRVTPLDNAKKPRMINTFVQVGDDRGDPNFHSKRIAR